MKRWFWAFRRGEWGVNEGGHRVWVPNNGRLRKAADIAHGSLIVLLVLFVIGPLAPFGWAAMDAVIPTTTKYIVLASFGLAATLVLYGVVAALVISVLLHRIWPSWLANADWGEGAGDWRD